MASSDKDDKGTTEQPVELGPGGLKIVRQGDSTVALQCVNILGQNDNSTISGVKASYDFVSGELYKAFSIVKAHKGDITPEQLKAKFCSSPLAAAADDKDWTIFVESFSPKTRERGRPKSAALTYLERKTSLDRNTIKSYCSRAKKPPKPQK